MLNQVVSKTLTRPGTPSEAREEYELRHAA